jgi:hypothetical protein
MSYFKIKNGKILKKCQNIHVYQKNLKRASKFNFNEINSNKFPFVLSYANCSLNKYMDKHNIRSDSRAFQLLTRLLTIDPTKRLSGMDLTFSRIIQ